MSTMSHTAQTVAPKDGAESAPPAYTQSDYHRVNCNLCGHQVERARYRLHGCQIVTCRICALSYTQPRVKTHLLEKKLQTWATIDTVDAQRLRIAYEANTLALYRHFLSHLAKHSDRPLYNARLLDVGCSVGAFLTQAQQMGCEVMGLEVGKASADFARKEKNIPVETGSIYSHDFAPESFDFISMMEVIEHVEDPVGALKRLHAWLKPGGSVFLTTPNFDSLYRRCHGNRWWVIDCEDEHIFFFNKASLEKALLLAGFEVQALYTRGFDLAGILRQATQRLTQKLTHKPRSVQSALHSDPLEQEAGYFQARSRKEQWKMRLKRLGLIKVVRLALKALDWLASTKGSPLYAQGEQLIIIARKPERPRGLTA